MHDFSESTVPTTMRDTSESTLPTTMLREVSDTMMPASLQYSIDTAEEVRGAAYQFGLQAMDRADERSLTPIYFSSSVCGPSFDTKSSFGSGQSAGQNYYAIKNTFTGLKI